MSRLSAIFCMILVAAAVTRAAERPNIIWIIADDLGPEVSCYDYADVATPNLDRLAAAGTRFTHAFSTSPVCSASRTAFQTGQYQTTVGGHHHNTRDKPVLPDSIPTVTGLMQKAGYFVSNGRGSSIAEKDSRSLTSTLSTNRRSSSTVLTGHSAPKGNRFLLRCRSRNRIGLL